MTSTDWRLQPIRRKLPTRFVEIVEECLKCNNNWGLLQNDIIFATTYWLMIDSGFAAVTKDKKKLTEDVILPEGWKHGSKELYEACFILPPYSRHLVRLIGLPAQDAIYLNVTVKNVSPRNFNLKSLAISTPGFVPRPKADDVSLKFADVIYTQVYIKSLLIWPIRCSILTDVGIINACLLGLSDELKLNIMNFLEVRDLLALAETCRDMNRVINDQGFWKRMFHKHFKTHCKCGGNTRACRDSNIRWKENFRYYYRLKYCNKNSQHSSVESFHTAPDILYYDLTYD